MNHFISHLLIGLSAWTAGTAVIRFFGSAHRPRRLAQNSGGMAADRDTAQAHFWTFGLSLKLDFWSVRPALNLARPVRPLKRLRHAFKTALAPFYQKARAARSRMNEAAKLIR